MTGLIRRALLAVAMIAFALQVATVANLRCEMPQTADPLAVHAGHHAPPTPGAHQSNNCTCVAGCHLGFGGVGGVLVALAEPSLFSPGPAPADPTPPLPLAARPHALPLAQAPPASV